MTLHCYVEKGRQPIGERAAQDQRKREATNERAAFDGWPPELASSGDAQSCDVQLLTAEAQEGRSLRLGKYKQNSKKSRIIYQLAIHRFIRQNSATTL